jgi:hypothetical protein
MSDRERAIKIEQLKNERAEAHNATFSEILSTSREIDGITNEMFKLGDKLTKFILTLKVNQCLSEPDLVMLLG